MKRSFLVLIILINVVLVSCIPTKELVYIQPTEAAIDSTFVVQELPTPYRIQIHDILIIRV